MTTFSKLAIDTVPLPERGVRIAIPAEVAFNLDKLTKALGNVAERLGCKPCLSGADCTLVLHRDFVINPQTLAAEVAGGVIIDSHRIQ